MLQDDEGSLLSSGILYPWYKVVQDGMYWYEPVRMLVATGDRTRLEHSRQGFLPAKNVWHFDSRVPAANSFLSLLTSWGTKQTY